MIRIANERLSNLLDPARPADWPTVEEAQAMAVELGSTRDVFEKARVWNSGFTPALKTHLANFHEEK